MNVLLVEDDEDLRRLLIDELALYDVECHGVGSALTFYQQLATHSYSVAIIDVCLPDQSGYELARYLRDNTQMGIIMLSALGSERDRIRGYEHGADIYFIKPVVGAELAQALENLHTRLKLDDREGSSTTESCWCLDSRKWKISSPEGHSLALNARENQFIRALIENAGGVAERDELIVQLGYSDNSYGHHALETMVMRLRQKLAHEEGDSLIKTVRGVGYKLNANACLLGQKTVSFE